MPTFKFNKLIRDKILAKHLESGHDVTYQKLTDSALKLQLIRKLHEEADEIPVRKSVSADIIEEIGDVQQVLDDLKTQYGLMDETVRQVQQAKRAKKGGFSEGIYIDQISLPESDEWTSYYRASPDKYPEVTRETDSRTQLPTVRLDGVYEHYKGKRYEVLGVGYHTETTERYVVYKPLYEHANLAQLYVRPYDMFIGTVMVDDVSIPRFRRIDEVR